MPQVQEAPVISMDNNITNTVNNHHPLYHPHNNMEEFFVSIKKDAEAALALAERLKTDVVKNFVNVIEKCGGTLITSGIGEAMSIIDILTDTIFSDPQFFSYNNMFSSRLSPFRIFF